MEVIEDQPKHQIKSAERLAKPLRACFKYQPDTESEWLECDAEHMIASGLIKHDVPLRPSSKVIGECAEQVAQVRQAQQTGEHGLAIQLTTRALQLIRQQPKYRRSSLNRQVQELLNLRSLSLISVGETGEAWRCITLMSKLWDK